MASRNPLARSIATDEPAVPVSSMDALPSVRASHSPTRRPCAMKSDPRKTKCSPGLPQLTRSMRNTGFLPPRRFQSWREAFILAWREEYGVDSPCDEILDVGELLRSLPLRPSSGNASYAWQLRPDAIRFGDAPRLFVCENPTIFSFSRM